MKRRHFLTRTAGAVVGAPAIAGTSPPPPFETDQQTAADGLIGETTTLASCSLDDGVAEWDHECFVEERPYYRDSFEECTRYCPAYPDETDPSILRVDTQRLALLGAAGSGFLGLDLRLQEYREDRKARRRRWSWPLLVGREDGLFEAVTPLWRRERKRPWWRERMALDHLRVIQFGDLWPVLFLGGLEDSLRLLKLQVVLPREGNREWTVEVRTVYREADETD